MRRWQALGSLLLVSTAGVPVYFIAFLLAYGFRDSVGVGSHAFFVGVIGIFAVVAALASLAIPLARPPRPPAGPRWRFAVLASVSLNATVLFLGSLVSASHKADGSVSQSFSTTTDVLVASAFVVVALVSGWLAINQELRGIEN